MNPIKSHWITIKIPFSIAILSLPEGNQDLEMPCWSCAVMGRGVPQSFAGLCHECVSRNEQSFPQDPCMVYMLTFWGILMVNVTIYGIHGSYGICDDTWWLCCFLMILIYIYICIYIYIYTVNESRCGPMPRQRFAWLPHWPLSHFGAGDQRKDATRMVQGFGCWYLLVSVDRGANVFIRPPKISSWLTTSLPSGNLLHSYRTSPFLIGKASISMGH